MCKQQIFVQRRHVSSAAKNVLRHVLEIFVRSRHQKPSREVERRNGRNIQKKQ